MRTDVLNNKKLVNFEVMGGWPLFKMDIREILIELGAKLNKETNTWEIQESEKLDICPCKIEDDGMGYGVRQEWITNVQMDEDCCYLWVVNELEHLDCYREAGIYPCETFHKDGIEYEIRRVGSFDRDNDNNIYFTCDSVDEDTSSRIIITVEEMKELKEKEDKQRKELHDAIIEQERLQGKIDINTLEYPEIWKRNSILPGEAVNVENKKFVAAHIDETDEGFIFIFKCLGNDEIPNINVPECNLKEFLEMHKI